MLFLEGSILCLGPEPMIVSVAWICHSNKAHAETVCQRSEGTLLSTTEAGPAPPAGMTVQRLRLYCLATQDLGYVQISLGNTAIAVGACGQQTGCQGLTTCSRALRQGSHCTGMSLVGSRRFVLPPGREPYSQAQAYADACTC